MDWNFKVSTGLKSIIGRELITDEFIAIFELIKNSYDAGANNVKVEFKDIYQDNSKIIISDDGHGMNADDIQNKWLFVAYSEKKEGERAGSYRDRFSERVYAGAKGVGRFSCDRLGKSLKLYSHKRGDKETNYIMVDWSRFEMDSKEEFMSVPVKHGMCSGLPSGFSSGTTIEILGLRNRWSRESILKLKKSLSKMVNPDMAMNKNDQFNIYIHCAEEKETDQAEIEKLGVSENLNDEIIKEGKNIVNGLIKNYVFEALNIKTTLIQTEISEDGETIVSSMHDRGMFLFEIKQRNRFSCLKNIKARLFQLNRSAKINFRKVMGIAPVQYGSIFIYKNGFRIMPYGEPGNDVFDIDKRKAQGYNRYLGTRDLVGRIEIYGSSDYLRETTSRDGGFIKTSAYFELVDFFIQYVLRPLEKYVVELINWGDPLKGEESSIEPEEIRSNILAYITGFQKSTNVISVKCNPDLFEIVDEKRKKNQPKEFKELRQIAEELKSDDLQKIAKKIERNNQKLKKERLDAAKEAEAISIKLEQARNELETTHQQTLFLRNLANPKYENAVESLHMINTYAKSIKINLDKTMKEMAQWGNKEEHERIQNRLFEIMKAVQKISSIYNIVCHAEYDIKVKTIETDVTEFLREYIEGAFFPRTGEILHVDIKSDGKPHILKFNPMEFGILIENIVYNSLKAKAHNIVIDVAGDGKETVIDFIDDGIGLNCNVSTPERVFELGYTTTNGSGVGLAHVKKIVEDMGGTVAIDANVKSGFKIEMRI